MVRSALGMLEDIDWTRTDKLYTEMADEGATALVHAGCKSGEITSQFGADLRYFGQQNEVSVTFKEDPRTSKDPKMIRVEFERAYQAQYGFNPSHVPVEIVSWRLTVRGPLVPFHPAGLTADKMGAPKGNRLVQLWEDDQLVPVYERGTLGVAQKIDGPAIIEERETTIVIPPHWHAKVDDYGCVVATLENAS
jgi:N-methylhydantoinase A